MAPLLLFLALIGAAQACSPTSSTTWEPITQQTPPLGRSRKRATELVVVTVVTNRKFDPSLNDTHMQTMKSLLDDYTKSKGVVYDKRMVKEAVKNVGGQFAVHYTVQNADCGEVSDFARGAKREANFITRMRVRCGGRPAFIIN
ncbi:hypothetical protein Y032_0059g3052 [Ancylostoma ceylanicum]|uniref:Cystatin domain-containing protein n=1 Tax=Ancylostoma ceylanicum TaxID=53326 RepID=A0A016U3Q9_9BILA|nr:hypothetical protein Y032_0059g3052 [Ancylostoma ceylanicum]